MAQINEGTEYTWKTAEELRAGVLAVMRGDHRMLVVKYPGDKPAYSRIINVENGIGGFGPSSMFRELKKPCTIELNEAGL